MLQSDSPGNRRGYPVNEPRVLRGGAWNNNSDNARAGYRNNNNPDNRNNHIGFRVVCSSHIRFRPGRCRRVLLVTADGVRRRAVGWMARDYPGRASADWDAGRIHKPGTVWANRPAALSLILVFGRLANPSAQETSNFSDQYTYMFILPIGEPAPTVNQAEVEAQFVERGIGFGELVAPSGTAPGLGPPATVRKH